ncbi:hypothetical protein BATDEDRAFT_23741 [Batrachochytrium dendrobatidis JAM81]|uniref:MORN repeat protein n=2 Tax=Batrachochytrium dendrobatidis TaxID=109871 RepID=F4NY79_BATDJ|nr:uncharacterized protein BATDEDRAFT_23741 [Batrachochytrium dendrobatidis JAM81]EGF81970.1 hypothetical protein BATDEDRAFT_23741 [Batrachochytrium dendrobatidis JAM81]KAJ8324341.1 spermatogenesis [Batrachochytrium dendrobatidis]KAK5670592.1 spermatogenesis [Batrachochytrium dendrobatidis]OAJ40743.1 hypothetical protein BDEG_24443 [Batrachochytrium dendrobatidis JEL423]|eukprot:XP_006677359.1 hypothetical protein BATDEDRAFT_23741 [Batrachochytrium dendrobatidis JAM81]
MSKPDKRPITRQDKVDKSHIANKDVTSTQCKTGVYIFKDGSKYEGEYKEIDGGGIVRNGMGKYSCGTTHGVYNGQWDHDKMNGKGRLDLESGASYEGNWKDNQYMGSGTYRWADGSAFIGEWLENGMNGPGKYVDATGQSWTGSVVKGSVATLSPELHSSNPMTA